MIRALVGPQFGGKLFCCVFIAWSILAVPDAQAEGEEPSTSNIASNKTIDPYVLAVSGGVSFGAYEAGANWALVQYLRAKESATLTGVTGASAGSINTLLTAVEWCDWGRTQVSDNVFRRAWLPIGLDGFLANGEEVSSEEALLDRAVFNDAIDLLKLKINRPQRPGCWLNMGVTATRIEPAITEVAGLAVPNQRFLVPFRAESKNRRMEFTPNLPSEDWRHLTGNNVLRLSGKTSAETYSSSTIFNLVQASSAFPLAFGPVCLNSCTEDGQAVNTCQGIRNDEGATSCPSGHTLRSDAFVDGGFFDNVPLGMAIALNEEPTSTLSSKRRAPSTTYIFMDPDFRRTSAISEAQEDAVYLPSLATNAKVLSGAIDTAQQYELEHVVRSYNFGEDRSTLESATRVDLEALERSLSEVSELSQLTGVVLLKDDTPVDQQHDARCWTAALGSPKPAIRADGTREPVMSPAFADAAHDWEECGQLPMSAALSCVTDLAKDEDNATLIDNLERTNAYAAALACSASLSVELSASKIKDVPVRTSELPPNQASTTPDELRDRAERLVESLSTIADRSSRRSKALVQLADAPAERHLLVLNRFAPVVGDMVGNFAAFLDEPLREFDYYAGVYDAIITLAGRHCPKIDRPGSLGAPECLASNARDVFDQLHVSPEDKLFYYVFRRLLLAELIASFDEIPRARREVLEERWHWLFAPASDEDSSADLVKNRVDCALASIEIQHHPLPLSCDEKLNGKWQSQVQSVLSALLSSRQKCRPKSTMALCPAELGFSELLHLLEDDGYQAASNQMLAALADPDYWWLPVARTMSERAIQVEKNADTLADSVGEVTSFVLQTYEKHKRAGVIRLGSQPDRMRWLANAVTLIIPSYWSADASGPGWELGWRKLQYGFNAWTAATLTAAISDRDDRLSATLLPAFTFRWQRSAFGSAIAQQIDLGPTFSVEEFNNSPMVSLGAELAVFPLLSKMRIAAGCRSIHTFNVPNEFLDDVRPDCSLTVGIHDLDGITHLVGRLIDWW